MHGAFRPLQIAAIVALEETGEVPPQEAAGNARCRDVLCDGLQRTASVSQATSDGDRLRVATAPARRPCATCGSLAERLAIHNLALADGINQAGRCYLTPSVLKGKRMIRVSIGAQATEREHVEGLWRELQEAAGRRELQEAAGR